MLGRRGRLPVLAEIGGPDPGRSRVWSLRREDFARLAEPLRRVASLRTVMIGGGEGEIGPLAVALAGAAVASGRRTILVECDFGRPRLAAELGLAEAPGLHEYLRWEATAPELLQPLAVGGPAAGGAVGPLVCVAAGRRAEDPRTLLGLPSFGHVNEKLRGAYDLVVLWAPPLDGDPVTLATVAAHAEATLAAIPPEAARSGRIVRATRRALRRLPAPPLGAVVVGQRS